MRINLTKSRQSKAYDMDKKRYFIDCSNNNEHNPLGYNHPSFNDVQFYKDMLDANRNKVIGIETPISKQFEEEFMDCKWMKPFKYFIFTDEHEYYGRMRFHGIDASEERLGFGACGGGHFWYHQSN